MRARPTEAHSQNLFNIAHFSWAVFFTSPKGGAPPLIALSITRSDFMEKKRVKLWCAGSCD
jgi:hypothetical protein